MSAPGGRRALAVVLENAFFGGFSVGVFASAAVWCATLAYRFEDVPFSTTMYWLVASGLGALIALYLYSENLPENVRRRLEREEAEIDYDDEDDVEGPFVVAGQIHVHATGASIDEAVRAYRERYEFSSPDSWENVETEEDGEILGFCEGCERAIVDGDSFYRWDEGLLTCSSCGGANDQHKPQGKED